MAKKSDLTESGTIAAQREIRELVEKFAEHRETYHRAGYNETQLRQDFLDPLFIALGWDVYNRQGFAEAYRDVILEQGLRVEKSVRAPDYCLRVGGTAKFFVEAKKPAVDIKSEVGPAFQLRRYAAYERKDFQMRKWHWWSPSRACNLTRRSSLKSATPKSGVL